LFPFEENLQEKRSKETQYVYSKSAGAGTARFEHVLAWASIADLRIIVYLGFSWLLHIGIWGIPGVPGRDHSPTHSLPASFARSLL
jgi:hypothetical protein